MITTRYYEMIGMTLKMIEVYLPKIFPTMTERDALKIVHWYVSEGDVVNPNDLLIQLDTPPGLRAIPTPPAVIGRCRVQQLHKQVGDITRLGDLFITLEPLS